MIATVWLSFLLVTVDEFGDVRELHGRFAQVEACEYAATIVEQDRHPLPPGYRIICEEIY